MCMHHMNISILNGLLRELNPGPLAPEARIIPLDQAANETKAFISKAQANVNKMGRIA